MNKKRKVLITGGAGFIGTNIAINLLKNDFEVIIYDNFSEQIHGKNRTLVKELQGKVELVIADIIDKSVLYSNLYKVTDVIHLAAETGTGQSMYEISKYTEINILGTSLICDFLVNEKHEIKNVIVASSRSIYGEGKYLNEHLVPVYPNSRRLREISENFEVKCPDTGKYNLNLTATDEKSKLHPSSIYGITKLVQEQLVLLTTKIVGINGFALRYQNVYGPGQSLNNPYTGILSIFTKLALNNETINVFEDGNESRDFVFIDDVVDATTQCLFNKELVGSFSINVGSGVNTPVIEVANEIIKYTNSKSNIVISGMFREGDIRHNYADITLAKKLLNFNPKYNFKDGLHHFIDWAMKQDNLEDESSKNLYENSLMELKNKGLLYEK